MASVATVLMTWELGSGYGHIARLLPVALALKERGHDPVLALREVVRADTAAAEHGLPVIQAPVYPDTIKGLPPPASFAEVLFHLGYLDAKALTALCRAWREIVRLTKPALIVCDASPTCLLQSAGLDIPRVTLGDGYCCPPLQTPMPVLRWWQTGKPGYLAGAEDEVLRNANRARAALGIAAANSVAEFLRADEEFLCTFAELDHYPGRNTGGYLGPLPATHTGRAPEWPVGSRRLFGYVRSDYPHLDVLLRSLARSGHAVLMHVPGTSPAGAAKYRTSNLILSPEPVQTGAAIRDCDAVICHASAGLTTDSLLAGKPLLLLPTHVEQFMIAKRAEALGAAINIAPNEVPPYFESRLASLLKTDEHSSRAMSFATRHSAHDPARVVASVADRCEQLMKGQRGTAAEASG